MRSCCWRAIIALQSKVPSLKWQTSTPSGASSRRREVTRPPRAATATVSGAWKGGERGDMTFGVSRRRREWKSQRTRRNDFAVTTVERILRFKVLDQRSIGVVSTGPVG